MDESKFDRILRSCLVVVWSVLFSTVSAVASDEHSKPIPERISQGIVSGAKLGLLRPKTYYDDQGLYTLTLHPNGEAEEWVTLMNGHQYIKSYTVEGDDIYVGYSRADARRFRRNSQGLLELGDPKFHLTDMQLYAEDYKDIQKIMDLREKNTLERRRKQYPTSIFTKGTQGATRLADMETTNVWFPGYIRSRGSATKGLYQKTQQERLDFLRQNPYLTALSLSRPTEEDVKAFAAMPRLEYLTLDCAFLDSRTLAPLRASQSLKRLTIRTGFDDSHRLPSKLDLDNITSIDLSIIPFWQNEASGDAYNKLWEIRNRKPQETSGPLDRDENFPDAAVAPVIDAATIPRDSNILQLLLVCSTVKNGKSLSDLQSLRSLRVEAYSLPTAAYDAIASLKNLSELGIYCHQYDVADLKVILEKSKVGVISVFRPPLDVISATARWANAPSVILRAESNPVVTFKKGCNTFLSNFASAELLECLIKNSKELRFVQAHDANDIKVIEAQCTKNLGWHRTDQ